MQAGVIEADVDGPTSDPNTWIRAILHAQEEKNEREKRAEEEKR